MHAIAVHPGKPGTIRVERPEPTINAETDVVVEVVEVGVCGTDREEVSGGRADAPQGSDELVIGHEMRGRVVEAGKGVTDLHTGDDVVLTVRRSCDHCPMCNAGRPDYCQSGGYTERGIRGRDGYQCERVVDDRANIIAVGASVAGVAALAEPTSVAEKAITESILIQRARLPTYEEVGKRALVAGIGPVGLLAGMALCLRGMQVTGMDIVDDTANRVQALTAMGGRYIDGRQVKASDLDDQHGGPFDLILDATGASSIEINLIDALATNGIYVLTGIPSGGREIPVAAGDLLRQLVLGNQLILGSVNASHEHFQLAIRDLELATARWPGVIEGFITARHRPEDFEQAFGKPADSDIKTVITWKT
ncbi:MAG TPA: glucose 1-dehydrogenase [Tepidiformaceae bacterium]|nr:glucose 1-dehydrogenase [Tepidiformaceae bacterium]